jgi:hypothetical protein
MLAWVGWRGREAVAELAGDYTVVGLFRTYHQPYEGPDGWVIDPRPGDLAAEVYRRFKLGTPPDPAPKGRAEWAAALTGAGVQVLSTDAPWQGLNPRLYFGAPAPRLFIGAFGRQPVVFDPARGVLLHQGPVPPGPGLEIIDRREAAW